MILYKPILFHQSSISRTLSTSSWRRVCVCAHTCTSFVQFLFSLQANWLPLLLIGGRLRILPPFVSAWLLLWSSAKPTRNCAKRKQQKKYSYLCKRIVFALIYYAANGCSTGTPRTIRSQFGCRRCSFGVLTHNIAAKRQIDGFVANKWAKWDKY